MCLACMLWGFVSSQLAGIAVDADVVIFVVVTVVDAVVVSGSGIAHECNRIIIHNSHVIDVLSIVFRACNAFTGYRFTFFAAAITADIPERTCTRIHTLHCVEVKCTNEQQRRPPEVISSSWTKSIRFAHSVIIFFSFQNHRRRSLHLALITQLIVVLAVWRVCRYVRACLWCVNMVFDPNALWHWKRTLFNRKY